MVNPSSNSVDKAQDRQRAPEKQTPASDNLSLPVLAGSISGKQLFEQEVSKLDKVKIEEHHLPSVGFWDIAPSPEAKAELKNAFKHNSEEYAKFRGEVKSYLIEQNHCLGLNDNATPRQRVLALQGLKKKAESGDQDAQKSVDSYKQLTERKDLEMMDTNMNLWRQRNNLDHQDAVFKMRENYSKNLNAIEHNPNLADNQKRQIIDSVSSICDKANTLSGQQKERLLGIAAGVANDIAYPATGRQGYNRSCGEASVANTLTAQFPERYASIISEAVTTGSITFDGKKESVMPPEILYATEDPGRSPATNVLIRIEEKLVAEKSWGSNFEVDPKTGADLEVEANDIGHKFRGTTMSQEKVLLEQFTQLKYGLTPELPIGKPEDLNQYLNAHPGDTLVVGISTNNQDHLMSLAVTDGGYNVTDPNSGQRRTFSAKELFDYVNSKYHSTNFQMRLLYPNPTSVDDMGRNK